MSEVPTPERPLTTYSATPTQQGKTQARLLRKRKFYERIHELHAGAMSLHKIGEELGQARGTVRKYFRQAPEPTLPTPRPLRASKLGSSSMLDLPVCRGAGRLSTNLATAPPKSWKSRIFADLDTGAGKTTGC